MVLDIFIAVVFLAAVVIGFQRGVIAPFFTEVGFIAQGMPSERDIVERMALRGNSSRRHSSRRHNAGAGGPRRLGGKSEITVDVRVISATNKDLKEEIKSAHFREDLYFRLNVFHIPLSPLKERREDIPVLVQHFIDRFSRDAGKKLQGVTPEALRLLTDYAWPGNIRELRNTLERAVILCNGGSIEREHLPSELATGGGESAYLKLPHGLPLREIEKEYILASLARLQNNKARTAQALGISEKTLYNKLYRYSGRGPRHPEDDLDEEAPPRPAAAKGIG